MSGAFTRFSTATSNWMGRPAAFTVALATVVVWALCGPIFAYSETWQLVINTSTTIITFLMVFLIQHTQNRDSKSVHLKLDELIRATQGAHRVMMDLEHLEDDELETVIRHYCLSAKRARDLLAKGESDTDDDEFFSPDNFLQDPRVITREEAEQKDDAREDARKRASAKESSGKV